MDTRAFRENGLLKIDAGYKSGRTDEARRILSSAPLHLPAIATSVIPRLLRLGNAAHQLEFFGVSMLVFRRGVFSWVSEHGEH
ncbi:hypothetical protein J6590_094773 [Homalodisca vitripennis]|nr:hypothetical protein J6590_094773 [Homalodisca vitripennis]